MHHFLQVYLTRISAVAERPRDVRVTEYFVELLKIGGGVIFYRFFFSYTPLFSYIVRAARTCGNWRCFWSRDSDPLRPPRSRVDIAWHRQHAGHTLARSSRLLTVGAWSRACLAWRHRAGILSWAWCSWIQLSWIGHDQTEAWLVWRYQRRAWQWAWPSQIVR